VGDVAQHLVDVPARERRVDALYRSHLVLGHLLAIYSPATPLKKDGDAVMMKNMQAMQAG
jgi:hypothetical protein